MVHKQIWIVDYHLAKRRKQGLSDLLDTHQVQPTEVKTPKQGKDHHHSLEKSASSLYIPEDSTRKFNTTLEAGVNGQTAKKQNANKISL